MENHILDYFEPTLLKHRDKVVIIEGERQYTAAQLNQMSRSLAGILIEKRDCLKCPMVVFLPKCADIVLANLAILFSGNFYTNLDIAIPIKRIIATIHNIDPALIITRTDLAQPLLAEGIDPDRLIYLDQINWAEGQSTSIDIDHRRKSLIDTDPMCIINTSGSTGTPKGVIINHRGILDFLGWAIECFQFDGTEIIGNLSPFHFDIYMFELCLSLVKGSTIVIIPENLKVFPINLLKYMQQMKISFLFWVPTIMVTIANLNILDKVDLSCLKLIWFAGEVMPTKHINIWRKNIPQATFVNLYGPIEISVDCTYYILDRGLDDNEPLPIGSICRNTDVLILTAENKLAAHGEIGELCVRGSSLASGYFNDLEKTRLAFTQNPLNTKYPELIYRTGDLVYVNEKNEIMFVGRKDYLIKHLGYRIELGEIEHMVVSLDSIRNACVLYNSAKKQITLFYEAEKRIDADVIIKQLSLVLPKYMLPTKFYQLEKLPMNPNGKIDRQKLTESFLGDGLLTGLLT